VLSIFYCNPENYWLDYHFILKTISFTSFKSYLTPGGGGGGGFGGRGVGSPPSPPEQKNCKLVLPDNKQKLDDNKKPVKQIKMHEPTFKTVPFFMFPPI